MQYLILYAEIISLSAQFNSQLKSIEFSLKYVAQIECKVPISEIDMKFS